MAIIDGGEKRVGRERAMSVVDQAAREGSFGGIPFPVRFLTLALLVGGLVGGVANFLVLPGLWPWEMSPLAYRFLAGAATAYVVGSLFVFASSRWVESELLLATVIIYGVPLVAAVMMQPAPIDWSKIVAQLFAGIVTVALAISIYYVWRERNSAVSGRNLGRTLRAYLLALGVLSLAVGALVFAVPKQSGFVWPWAALETWKVLDSRLIASMLLTIAGGSLLAWWRDDRGAARVFLAMLWAYCIVAGAGIILHAAATPEFVVADAVYVLIFWLVLAASVLAYVLGARRERSEGGGPEKAKRR
ncbi:MAG: hypothetical protein ACRDSJ_01370 [Rubrobacteraceae bacterium]